MTACAAAEYFRQLAANREVRVALLGDSEEVRAALERLKEPALQPQAVQSQEKR
jgi:hypothetical protein